MQATMKVKLTTPFQDKIATTHFVSLINFSINYKKEKIGNLQLVQQAKS